MSGFTRKKSILMQVDGSNPELLDQLILIVLCFIVLDQSYESIKRFSWDHVCVL